MLCIHGQPRNRCPACRPARLQPAAPDGIGGIGRLAPTPVWDIKVQPPDGAQMIAMIVVVFACRNAEGHAAARASLAFYEDSGMPPEIAHKIAVGTIRKHEAAVAEARTKEALAETNDNEEDGEPN